MSIHLLVDGNYLYFQAREAGKEQDFTRLVDNIQKALGDKITNKVFYTRPPASTEALPVIDWLREHGWLTRRYAYDKTKQDIVSINMLNDAYKAYFRDPKCTTVLVSGSGSMTSVVRDFPSDVVVLTTTQSCNERLAKICDEPAIKHVSRLDLHELL